MIKVNKLSEYREIRCIYKGDGRAAYLCESLKSNNLVILKKIWLKSINEQEKKEALREAEILKILEHPNIIKFRDFFIENDTLCIAMDYADGGDLWQKIYSSETYISENQILDWFAQICLALKHIHDRKIIHRDIKSSNIFLTSMNIVKLGDFGISSFLGHTNDFLKSFAGTYIYLSPEIIHQRPYNYKTDIWSLGVVLYELCALKPPFMVGNNDKRALERKIKEGKFRDLPPVYSEELKELVRSLLVLDVNKRPNINQILKMGIIKNRIKKFLSEVQFKDEFSHTVLHNRNFNPKNNKKELNFVEEELKKINSLEFLELESRNKNNFENKQNSYDFFNKQKKNFKPFVRKPNLDKIQREIDLLFIKHKLGNNRIFERKFNFVKNKIKSKASPRILNNKKYSKDLKKFDLNYYKNESLEEIEKKEKNNLKKRKEFYSKIELLRKELKSTPDSFQKRSIKEIKQNKILENDNLDLKKIHSNKEISLEKIDPLVKIQSEILDNKIKSNLRKKERKSVIVSDNIKNNLIKQDMEEYKKMIDLYKSFIEEIETDDKKINKILQDTKKENFQPLLEALHKEIIGDYDSEDFSKILEFDEGFENPQLYSKFLLSLDD